MNSIHVEIQFMHCIYPKPKNQELKTKIMNILEKIVLHKKKEVAELKSRFPVSMLEKTNYFQAPVVSLKEFLTRTDKLGIIAEFKRKSPSKPSINLSAEIEKVTKSYVKAGASALSILTDQDFLEVV